MQTFNLLETVGKLPPIFLHISLVRSPIPIFLQIIDSLGLVFRGDNLFFGSCLFYPLLSLLLMTYNIFRTHR